MVVFVLVYGMVWYALVWLNLLLHGIVWCIGTSALLHPEPLSGSQSDSTHKIFILLLIVKIIIIIIDIKLTVTMMTILLWQESYQ